MRVLKDLRRGGASSYHSASFTLHFLWSRHENHDRQRQAGDRQAGLVRRRRQRQDPGSSVLELARRLRGKHKPVFTPHVDTGDYLVVINADKIAVTGNKLQDKMYYRFTGYIGNMKSSPSARRSMRIRNASSRRA